MGSPRPQSPGGFGYTLSTENLMHGWKCDGKRPACTRCLNRKTECQFVARDDGRGTAPKSLVLLLKDRIELLERALWLHSIDVDACCLMLCTAVDRDIRFITLLGLLP